MDDSPKTRVPTGLPEDPGSTFDPNRTARREELRDNAGPITPCPAGTVENRDATGVESQPLIGDKLYLLHRIIGRGGFGEVWEATQNSLQRTVALKRLREDVVQKDPRAQRLVEDFRNEALTAAALEHPNIVPAYDAEVDADGRPQLVLKLVRGETWQHTLKQDLDLSGTEYLQKHLPILIDVAQAVAFAHSRGVMHRDIKPSQVMVGEFGEVLLSDWGLALGFGTTPTQREVGSDDVEQGPGAAVDAIDASPPTTTARSLETATCPAGTPAYMAPEQTDAIPDRLGPWTDVYLLGATLYQLLTGTPLRTGVTAAGAFVTASLGDIEAPRDRAPDREIPYELERLAVSALAPEPEDRPTAKEFITALQEYLSGASQRRKSRELTETVQRSSNASDDDYATLSQGLADLAQAEGLWSANPDIDILREDLLERYSRTALANGDLELARRQANQIQDHGLRTRLGDSIERRQRDQRRTAAQRRFFLAASIILGLALIAFSIKYTVDQQRAHHRLEAQRNAAVTAREQAEALTTFMLEDLTPNLEALGRLDLLDQVAQKSLDYYANLAPSEGGPGVLARRSLALRNAGRVFLNQGRFTDARAAVERSLDAARELVSSHPDNSRYRYQLGDRLLEKGALMQRTADPDAANHAYQRAIAIFEKLLSEEPENPRFRSGLARGLHGTAYEFWAQGDFDEAITDLDRAISLLRPLIEDQDQQPEVRSLLQEILVTKGDVSRDQGRLDQAAVAIREAIALGESLTRSDPTNNLFENGLSSALSSLGFVLWQDGDLEGALAAYQRCLSIESELAESDPTNRSKQRNLANTLVNVGEMLADLNRPREALPITKKAVEILGPLVAANPDNADWRYTLAYAQVELGLVHRSLNHPQQARQAWERAVDEIKTVALERNDVYYLDTLARALLLLGRSEEAQPITDILRNRGWKNPAFLELLNDD